MRTIPKIVILSLGVLMLASCGKYPLDGTGHAPAIKLKLGGVMGTKASVITTESIKSEGFNISAYVTEPWKKDLNGTGPDIQAGIFVDTDSYDEGTYPEGGNKLKDVHVSYDDSRDNEAWRIAGNDGAGYAGHRFSWVNNKTMYFFSYAPVSATGRTISKADSSTDDKYPFRYEIPATEGIVGPSDCADLIFAFTPHKVEYETDPSSPRYGKLKSGSKDVMDIHFYHAMAQIRFCLSTSDGSFDPSCELVSVKLLGIYSEGGCTFNGSDNSFDWDNLATPVDYLQTFNSSFSGSSAPDGWSEGTYSGGAYNLFTNTGDVLLVIPQSLSLCRVQVTLRQGGSTTTITGKLPVTTIEDGLFWDAGMYYTYKISTVGKGDEIILNMTLADWAEREDYIPID